MGRNSSRVSALAFLGIIIKILLCQSGGVTPYSSNPLKIWVNTLMKLGARNFRTFDLILSIPALLDAFNFVKMRVKSSS